MKPIRSISQLGTRVREQGRLRMGVKTGSAMKALRHWRFTSPEREPLEQLAALYGGKVKPWSDSKAGQGGDQFELLSTSAKIHVFIPPGGLSTWYEEWSGGGIKRRCDGETVWLDGDEEKPTPCICNASQKMVCKPKTRLSVVLPEIQPFGGVWRLDTGSWNAADEMAAMERMLDALQVDGLVNAELLIEERQKMVKGRKSKFVVPVILVSASAQQALDAPDGLALLAPAPALALEAGAGPEVLADPSAATQQGDEPDIVDAQIVDIDGYDRSGMDERLTIALDLIVQRHEVTYPELAAAFAVSASNGDTTDLDALADSQHAGAVTVAERMAQGQRQFLGIKDGRLVK